MYRGLYNATPEEGPRPAPTPRQPEGRVGRFVLFLVLILALTAAGAAMHYLQPGAEEPFPWEEPAGEEGMALYVPQESFELTLEEPEETLSAQAVYEKASPAVVGIRAYLEEGAALGTGIVLTSDGYLLTNAHVIAGATSASAVLADGETQEALLVGEDEEMDLAVLKIDRTGLTPAQFGDSDLLRVGDVAYVIGNPLGEELRGTMTDGIISSVRRRLEVRGEEMDLIQTTAAINAGNSGGALLNSSGQVVGVTNMKLVSPFVTIEGLGFAIPASTVQAVVSDLLAAAGREGP